MRFKETRQFQLVITTEKTRVGPVGPTESVVTRQLEREREPLHVYTAAVGIYLYRMGRRNESSCFLKKINKIK